MFGFRLEPDLHSQRCWLLCLGCLGKILFSAAVRISRISLALFVQTLGSVETMVTNCIDGPHLDKQYCSSLFPRGDLLSFVLVLYQTLLSERTFLLR